MDKVEARIEVDELDHSSFTYEFYENKGKAKGLSNAANVVHSVDAYILRCIHRRCNYDFDMVSKAYRMLQYSMNTHLDVTLDPNSKMSYYIEQYERSSVADVVILPYLDNINMYALSIPHRDKLLAIMEGMLEYAPFEVVTVHDEFKCHPNKMNELRQQYINILSELADSQLLQDLLTQLYGQGVTYTKLSNSLSTLIRSSNYALC